MKRLKQLFVLSVSAIIVTLGSGCTSLLDPILEPRIEIQTEYITIPDTYTHAKPPPLVPTEGFVSMDHAFSMLSDLRLQHCVLWKYYIELVRIGTQGRKVLDDAGEDRCPVKVQ